MAQLGGRPISGVGSQDRRRCSQVVAADTGCRGRLRPWGWARERVVRFRTLGGPVGSPATRRSRSGQSAHRRTAPVSSRPRPGRAGVEGSWTPASARWVNLEWRSWCRVQPPVASPVRAARAAAVSAACHPAHLIDMMATERHTSMPSHASPGNPRPWRRPTSAAGVRSGGPRCRLILSLALTSAVRRCAGENGQLIECRRHAPPKSAR